MFFIKHHKPQIKQKLQNAVIKNNLNHEKLIALLFIFI